MKHASERSQPIEKQLVARIYGRGRGWVFTPTDFLPGFDRALIDKTLSQLTKKGVIRRIARGLYDYPRQSKLLAAELSPEIQQVVSALARKYHWRVLPSGATALHYLGLSTQIPAHFEYFSDGPSKVLTIGKTTIRFKKKVQRLLAFKMPETGVVVQALMGLGAEQVSPAVREQLLKVHSCDVYARMVIDAQRVQDWVLDIIKSLAKGVK